jgi:hypothetical protein
MLYGGDPRFDHLEGRIQGVEIRIDVASPNTAGKPEFERIVGGTELKGGEADVVMAIDKAGQHHMVSRAHDVIGLVLGRQLRVRTHFDNRAIALKNRAILDDLRRMAIHDFADHVPTTNQG